MTSLAAFCPGPAYPPEYVCVSPAQFRDIPDHIAEAPGVRRVLPDFARLAESMAVLALVPTFTAEKRAFAVFVNEASSLRSSMLFSSSPMGTRFAASGSELSPHGIRVVVPARHAISHRTGSGRSNRYPSGRRSAQSTLIFSMKRLTSLRVTASTGRLLPLYREGLLRSNPSGRFFCSKRPPSVPA